MLAQPLSGVSVLLFRGSGHRVRGMLLLWMTGLRQARSNPR